MTNNDNYRNNDGHCGVFNTGWHASKGCAVKRQSRRATRRWRVRGDADLPLPWSLAGLSASSAPRLRFGRSDVRTTFTCRPCSSPLMPCIPGAPRLCAAAPRPRQVGRPPVTSPRLCSEGLPLCVRLLAK